MSAKVIRAHDPRWQDAYRQEAGQIERAFGDCLDGIDHIGGTSIAGIFAKPVIDILVQARSLAEVEARSPAMMDLGYEARGEYGLPGRRYFSRKVSAASVTGYHVHVYQSGSADAFRHLAFRDFLVLHPQLADAYSELKRSLADSSGVLPPDYANLKSAFVQDIERQALAHFRRTR
ncbi:MAG: GrpB family protein [Micropepsaceae bacterium]